MTETVSQDFLLTLQEWASQTTPVDWLVGGWLLWCVCRGLMQGFGPELGRIVVAIIAIFGGLPLFHWLMSKTRAAQPDFENEAAGELLSLAITLFLIALLARLIHLGVKKGVDEVLTGWFSNLAGGVGGFLRGGIIYSAILLLVGASSLPVLKTAMLEKSLVGQFVAPRVIAPYQWLTAQVPILPPLLPEAKTEPIDGLPAIEEAPIPASGDLPLAPPPLDSLSPGATPRTLQIPSTPPFTP